MIFVTVSTSRNSYPSSLGQYFSCPPPFIYVIRNFQQLFWNSTHHTNTPWKRIQYMYFKRNHELQWVTLPLSPEMTCGVRVITQSNAALSRELIVLPEEEKVETTCCSCTKNLLACHFDRPMGKTTKQTQLSRHHASLSLVIIVPMSWSVLSPKTVRPRVYRSVVLRAFVVRRLVHLWMARIAGTTVTKRVKECVGCLSVGEPIGLFTKTCRMSGLNNERFMTHPLTVSLVDRLTDCLEERYGNKYDSRPRNLFLLRRHQSFKCSSRDSSNVSSS